MAASCVYSYAETRVALVIGNSAYKNVTRLQNPANDAAAVVGMFKKAGFDSVELAPGLERERDAPSLAGLRQQGA